MMTVFMMDCGGLNLEAGQVEKRLSHLKAKAVLLIP